MTTPNSDNSSADEPNYDRETLGRFEDEMDRLVRRTLENDVEFEEVQEELDDIQRRATAAADSQEDEQMIRRGVLSNRALLAELTDQPTEVYRDIHDKQREVGFPTLEAEILGTGSFARYCIQKSVPDAAKPYVKATLRKLKKAMKDNRTAEGVAWDEYRTTLEQLEEEISDSDR